MPGVSVRNLAKSGGDAHAVRVVCFDVEKGDVFALLGPNGTGNCAATSELTGWALEHDHAPTGLSVVRVTLEDVSLNLTRDATEASEPNARAVE